MDRKLLFLMLFIFSKFFSQILVNESFEGSSLPPGWSASPFGGTGTSAGLPCSGMKTFAATLNNQYASVAVKYSSGQSNGKDIFYSFKYLNKNIKANFSLKYSSDNGISWKTLPGFSSPSTTVNCISVSGSIPGTDVPIGSNFVFNINIIGSYCNCSVGIDDVQIIQNSTSFNCFLPTNVNSSNINNTSAQINWSSQSSYIPDNYEYYLSTNSLPPDSNALPTGSVSGSSTSTILNSLQPFTQYYIWLRSSCGTSQKSFWTNTYSFKTDCNPIGAMAENFSPSSQSVYGPLPDCWNCINLLGNVGDFDNNCKVQSNSSTEANLYFIGNQLTGPTIVRLPHFNNINSGSNRLRFKTWNSNYFQSNEEFDVGYMTDGSNISTFVNIQTIITTSSVTEKTVVIPNNLPPNARLGFRKVSHSNFVMVDDVYWEPVPLCSKPGNLTVSSNNSLGSVIISWTPVSLVNNYELYYSTNSTPPVATTVPNVSGIIGNSYTLTNLDPDKIYYIWVRSGCSLGGASDWTNYVTNQPCIPPILNQTTHGINDFTTTGGIYNINYSVNSNAIYNNQSSKILTVAKGTVFSYTASSVANLFNHYYYIWIDWDKDGQFDNINEKIVVQGPTSNFNGSYLIDSNRQTGLYKMRVGTSWNNGNLTPCDFSSNSVASFIDFTLEIVVQPSCIQPKNITATNITANSAEISWEGMTPIGLYDIYYSTSSTLPSMNAVPVVQGIAANTTTITNLNPYRKYYVWIRENCSTGNYSYWSIPISFETLCQPPVITSTSSGTSCSGGKVSLSATCSGDCSIGWYNTPTGGNLLHTGNSYLTDYLFASTPFYAQASYSKEISPIKPIYKASAYSITNDSGGLVFNVNEFFTLKSIDVFVNNNNTSNNNLTVQLLNNNDQIIYTKSFALIGKPTNTSLPMRNTLELNWNISPGMDYKIRKSIDQSILIFDDNGNFPINIGSVGIIKNSFHSTRYQYFFNWKVITYCNSQRLEVLANIDNTCLGVDEIGNKKAEIQIYPNPFENDLHINSKIKLDYIILNDISGKLIKKIENPNSVISLNDLSSGVYLLKIKLNNGSVRTFKIIKK